MKFCSIANIATKDGEYYIDLGEKQQLTSRGLSPDFEGNSVRQKLHNGIKGCFELVYENFYFKKTKYSV